MNKVTSTHLWLDERGVAWIDDSNTKVIEVVIDHVAWRWSPEAIHLQHPHLSLAQIHAALAYYFDHQAEFDAEMERMDREYQALREAQKSTTPTHQQLQTMAKAP